MSTEQAVRAWLREHGADKIDHPGGTLYAHLGRVHDRLGALGHDPWVQVAGLAHAVYGTNGPRGLAPEQVRPFTDLSIVNELDVAEQDPAFIPRHGDYFRTLFTAWAPIASPAVLAEARRVLG